LSVINRGAKNAFRNGIRSFSIIIILSISIALALVMLLAMRTVSDRINSIKSSIGNTITVSPAGQRGFNGGGTPLTADNVTQISNTPHVKNVSASVSDRLTTSTNSQSTSVNGPDNGGQDVGGTTNLTSPIAPGKLGRRYGGRGATSSTFSLPILVTGTTDPTSAKVSVTNPIKIISGVGIDGTGTKNEALIGKDLAEKNGLTIGGTFTAYNQSIIIAGIYDAGNKFSNAGIIMPLVTLQALSGQPGDITNVAVQVDSIANLNTTVTALQDKLGASADVVSAQDNSNQALTPLSNISAISLYSLIGALLAGSVIIFLTMLMIVRERRREIGVLKAIGASNVSIVGQFVTESLTLTLIGAVMGVIVGVILSNPVLNVLVTSGTSSNGGTGRMGGGFRRALGNIGGNISQLHAAIGWDILLYGLLAAIIIAILGSAIPAYFVSKIRPAEVMRNE
jgi:putative ABC transport system permease protein